jgi:DegV family protein with EDD domain
MQIITDSAADLPISEAEELGVRVAPLYLQFPDGEVRSGDLTPDEFYDRLAAMEPDIPTTTMPAPGEFADIYSETGGEILSIHISSGLSGTLEAARLGAERSGGNVTIVDSETLSGGERFQVLAAHRAIKEGLGKDAILEHLAQVRAATEVVYTLETLEYLSRGGRIGRVQALAGSLLKIKPIIHVDKADGKYSTLGSKRTIAKALEAIVDHLEQLYPAGSSLWVSVLHGDYLEQAQNLAALLQARLQADRLEILRISPVLGVHTGPGIVGAAVVPLEMMEG